MLFSETDRHLNQMQRCEGNIKFLYYFLKPKYGVTGINKGFLYWETT